MLSSVHVWCPGCNAGYSIENKTKSSFWCAADFKSTSLIYKMAVKLPRICISLKTQCFTYNVGAFYYSVFFFIILLSLYKYIRLPILPLFAPNNTSSFDGIIDIKPAVKHNWWSFLSAMLERWQTELSTCNSNGNR